jgi:hypothetical protein
MVITTKQIKSMEKTDATLAKAAKIVNVKAQLSKLAFEDKLILADTDLQNKLETMVDELQDIVDGLMLKVAQADLLKAGENNGR